MTEHIAISGYSMKKQEYILSHVGASAADSLICYLNMNLSEFINGLDGFEWHPSGRSLRFSADKYRSLIEDESIHSPTIMNLVKSAQKLGMPLRSLIEMSSSYDSYEHKESISFGPVPMRIVALIYITVRCADLGYGLSFRGCLKDYSESGGWDMSVAKLNEVIKGLSMSYSSFLALMEESVTDFVLSPADDNDYAFTRDELTSVIRGAYRESGITIEQAAYILDAESRHMKRLFQQDGMRNISLSTLSRMILPLGWSLSELFSKAEERIRIQLP